MSARIEDVDTKSVASGCQVAYFLFLPILRHNEEQNDEQSDDDQRHHEEYRHVVPTHVAEPLVTPVSLI